MAGFEIEKTNHPGIYKKTYLSGKVRYLAKFHRDGKQVPKTFHLLADAIRWKRQNDSHHDTKGLPLTNKLLEKTKVQAIVQRYLDAGISSRGKSLGVNDSGYLKNFVAWLKENGDPSLAAFDEEAAEDYKDELLESTWIGKGWQGEARQVTAPSVKRKLNSIRPVWKVARRKWGFKNLTNPWDGIVITGSDIVSTRRLKPGELDALEKAALKYGNNVRKGTELNRNRPIVAALRARE